MFVKNKFISWDSEFRGRDARPCVSAECPRVSAKVSNFGFLANDGAKKIASI